MRESPSVGQYVKQHDKQSNDYCGNKLVATTIVNIAASAKIVLHMKDEHSLTINDGYSPIKEQRYDL